MSDALEDPLLAPVWAYLRSLEGPNDGLVSVSSARWGTWRGTLPADHLALVGQLAGAVGFDQKAFFADVCSGLARLGY